MRSHTVTRKLLEQFAYDDPITGFKRLWRYEKGRPPYPDASPRTATRNRGVRDFYIVCTDSLKGFPDAIGSLFPQAQVQTCIVHRIRASLNYVSWKERKALAADLKPIYRALTAEAAASARRLSRTMAEAPDGG